MSLDELLKTWEMYHTCNCKGGKRKYYRKEAFKGYEIRINERRGTFQILLNNSMIAGPDWIYKLEPKMKELSLLNS